MPNIGFSGVPLDLLYHSKEIFVKEIFTYPSIVPDHFPLGIQFLLIEKMMDKKRKLKLHEVMAI